MSQLKDLFSQDPLLLLEADLWLCASETRENILWTSVSVRSSFICQGSRFLFVFTFTKCGIEPAFSVLNLCARVKTSLTPAIINLHFPVVGME
jgi:hypothetical protein